MPVDRNGTSLTLGDFVTFEQASQGLLRDLPVEDQIAIKAQIGKRLEIRGFNDQGNSELEFTDQEGVLHSIWVESSCIVKSNQGQ